MVTDDVAVARSRGMSQGFPLGGEDGFFHVSDSENADRAQDSLLWRRLWCHSAIKRFFTSAAPGLWGDLNLCLASFFSLACAEGTRSAEDDSLVFV